MEQWIIGFGVLYVIVYVSLMWYAARHQDDPLWRGYLDGLSGRYVIWDRKNKRE